MGYKVSCSRISRIHSHWDHFQIHLAYCFWILHGLLPPGTTSALIFFFFGCSLSPRYVKFSNCRVGGMCISLHQYNYPCQITVSYAGIFSGFDSVCVIGFTFSIVLIFFTRFVVLLRTHGLDPYRTA